MRSRIFNQKLAEFVGILLGDGSIGIYDRQYRIKVSLHSNDDLNYAFYVSDLVKDLFEISPIKKKRKNENTLDILIFNKKLVLFLIEKVGLKKAPKWNRAIIPSWVMDSYFTDFLRGYVDTDGSVVVTKNNGYLYPRIEMKVSPCPMQKQMIEGLNDLGIKFGCYNIGKGKVRIQINGKKQLQKWVDLVGFKNKRKLERAKKFL